jgi:hypothetical protein
MIKTLVACTSELDDAQLAVEEIAQQLNLSANQLKNSVGVISCHYEFVMSGVAKAIAESLPFQVTGAISNAQGIKGEAGALLLTLMVLTSDEARFVTKLTPSLAKNPREVIAKAYQEAAAAEKAKPALILAYAPFMVQNSGDDYVDVLSEMSGGVPCFGTLAVDDTQDFSKCYLLCGGQDYRDRMGLILIYGQLDPKFVIATISEDKILGKAALITKSKGHVLMEVNDRPVIEYFEDLGLTGAAGTSYAMTSLPFMLDYGDGTPPVSKVFIGLTPEKYASCAGAMPEGAILRLGVFDKEDVLFTTGEALGHILSNIDGASGLLAYACISRSMALGAESLAEMDLVRARIGGKLPFMIANSGGEICPTQVISRGKASNRFHNNAFVACIF